MNRRQKKKQVEKAKQHQASQRNKPKAPKGVTIGVPTAAADSQ